MSEPNERRSRLKKRLRIFIVIAFAATVLIYPCGWIIVSSLWHLTHPRTCRFAGYDITIPHSFINRPQPNGILLLRVQPVFARPPWRGEFVILNQHQGKVDIAKWKNASPSIFNSGGSTGSKALELEFNGAPIHCVQSSSGSIPVSVMCVSESGLFIQYFGNEEGLADFRKFLSDDFHPASP